jgi:hypothetical protein
LLIGAWVLEPEHPGRRDGSRQKNSEPAGSLLRGRTWVGRSERSETPPGQFAEKLSAQRFPGNSTTNSVEGETPAYPQARRAIRHKIVK